MIYCRLDVEKYYEAEKGRCEEREIVIVNIAVK